MEEDLENLQKIFDLIKQEILFGRKTYSKKFNSFHEGYGILLEEVDELWSEIKCKDFDICNIDEEAIQVAAMAIRIILDTKENAKY